jgi:hypothetical protein
MDFLPSEAAPHFEKVAHYHPFEELALSVEHQVSYAHHPCEDEEEEEEEKEALSFHHQVPHKNASDQ